MHTTSFRQAWGSKHSAQYVSLHRAQGAVLHFRQHKVHTSAHFIILGISVGGRFRGRGISISPTMGGTCSHAPPLYYPCHMQSVVHTRPCRQLHMWCSGYTPSSFCMPSAARVPMFYPRSHCPRGVRPHAPRQGKCTFVGLFLQTFYSNSGKKIFSGCRAVRPHAPPASGFCIIRPHRRVQIRFCW